MDSNRITELFEGIKNDYYIIRNNQHKNAVHRDNLINSLALRIFGAILMATGAALILTGVGLISLASLGSLPILIIAVASLVFGYDALIIGHNQSKLIAKVVNSKPHQAAFHTTYWSAFTNIFNQRSLPTTTLEAQPHVEIARADLAETIAVQAIYNFLTKPS